jgi:type II restriction enzyme
MDLRCDRTLAERYHSPAQIVRVLTEDWGTRELYCPACPSDRLLRSRANTQALDFRCPACQERFELKSSAKWNTRKINDAGFDAMLRAIRRDEAPNLLVLQYSAAWWVQNLMLVPRMFFTESVIEKRKPLSPTARRAHYVLCNIVLENLPPDGKIQMVSAGLAASPRQVREEYASIKKIADIPPTMRGWTLDVLKVVRRLGKPSFSLDEVYAFEPELRALHPKNQNVRPKIRQQLQVLRNLGFLGFVGRGEYRVRG